MLLHFPSVFWETFRDDYNHRDHLGTLRNITNDAGHLIAKFDLYPFGLRMPTGSDGIYASRRVFTGHERDVATGLDYMLARFRAPGIIPFLGVDPRPESAESGEAGSWNRYTYVKGRPAVLVDPTGGIPRTPGSGGERKDTIQIPVTTIVMLNCGERIAQWTTRFLETHTRARESVGMYLKAGVDLWINEAAMKPEYGTFEPMLEPERMAFEDLPKEVQDEYVMSFAENPDGAARRLAYHTERMFAGLITMSTRLVGADTSRNYRAFSFVFSHELGHADHAIRNLAEYLEWVNESRNREEAYADDYRRTVGVK